MHYLRVRLLKEACNQKDFVTFENRGSTSSAVKSRDESKTRVRLSVGMPRLETSLDVPERQESMALRPLERDLESPVDEVSTMYDADDDKEWVDDESRGEGEKKEGKNKAIVSSSTCMVTEDTIDEGFRGEPSKRKGDARDRGSGKLKGKGKSTSGLRIGFQQEKTKGLKDSSKAYIETEALSFGEGSWSYKDDEEKRETDDKYTCIIAGDLDISVPIRKAARAAESEAKAATASYEAIKAAGEAAADLVKAAALEVCPYM